MYVKIHWRREDISVITAFKFSRIKYKGSCESLRGRSRGGVVKNTSIKSKINKNQIKNKKTKKAIIPEKLRETVGVSPVLRL